MPSGRANGRGLATASDGGLFTCHAAGGFHGGPQQDGGSGRDPSQHASMAIAGHRHRRRRGIGGTGGSGQSHGASDRKSTRLNSSH